MEKYEIKPHLITKPIQLLSVWLIGLIIVNGSFLSASVYIESDSWLRDLLVIASVVNVPIFLFALFLLQTKFRPEMQEDSFYSKYLDKKTSKVVEVSKSDYLNKEIIAIKKEMKNFENISTNSTKSVPLLKSNDLIIGLNDYLEDHKEISNIINENNLGRIRYFGRRAGVKNPPPDRAISVRMDFNFQKLKPIIKALGNIYFDFINIWDDYEIDDKEVILLGSYGNTYSAPINEEFLIKIDEMTNEEFIDYLEFYNSESV